MEYYSAIQENEIMPFAATWMDLEIITLSEVSQTEKDKYYIISLTREIFKNKNKKPNPEKEIRFVVIRGGELDESDQKVQISSYKTSKYRGCNVQHDDCS